VPVECIVRGYLSGSGWKSYQKDSTVCGIKLPSGMLESAKIEQPIFTPSTKAETGHDINISFDEVKEIIGESTAMKLKDLTLKMYERARDHAEKKGIIIADTKMEFGIFNNEIIIIDEILTPDSSRFWGIKDYAPGRSQDSFDKQIVRDYLLTLDWDQTPPGPALPEDIVKKTSDRYHEILRILTG
jgi:phosphoribosylaminoimidazole-succinocarboxamide synthase